MKYEFLKSIVDELSCDGKDVEIKFFALNKNMQKFSMLITKCVDESEPSFVTKTHSSEDSTMLLEKIKTEKLEAMYALNCYNEKVMKILELLEDKNNEDELESKSLSQNELQNLRDKVKELQKTTTGTYLYKALDK